MNRHTFDAGNKMECLACHSEIQKGVEYCTYCGFPMLLPIVEISGDKQSESIPVRAGRSYIKERLAGLRIGLQTHYYRLEDNLLTLEREEEITLVQGEELEYGEIKWNEREFLRIESMETLLLELTVRQGEKIHKFMAPIRNPGGAECWHVGVLLQASLRAQVVIGSPESFTCSEEFSLFVSCSD